MRLNQVLLCLVVWTQISVHFAVGTCKCPDVPSNQGFFTDTPCNECPTGRIRSCSRGSSVAFHDTMCVYVSKKKYTQATARIMCSDSDGGGFLAFATSPAESQNISEYVGNELKQGGEVNGTYFWLGGKHKIIERTNQTFWLFEYRGYYENVPVSLLPTDINAAIAEGRTCLAGHTKLNTTLHARPCSEKLPAVCYNYRNVATHFCRQDLDKQWTLFQGKCYYAYSAPTSEEKKTYRTYFDAQAECKAMGGTLARVTDEATFNKTLAKGHGGIYYNITDGINRSFTEGRVEGWWEDGTPYDANALKPFWATDQPDEKPVVNRTDPERIIMECDYWRSFGQLPDYDNDYNRARCYEDRFQHCAQVFPSGSLADCPKCNRYYGFDWHADNPGKLSDSWCYFMRQGYICERGPKPNPAYYAVRGAAFRATHLQLSCACEDPLRKECRWI